MECWLRVSVPDRTGALGAMATAVASAGADIRSLDVVTVEDGIAVDDLVIDVPGSLEDIRRHIEQFEGVVVEILQPMPRLPSPAAPLEVAARLAETAPSVLLDVLVHELPRVFHGAWCAVLRARSPRPEVLAAGIGSPSFATVEVPWLPLATPRRLDPALWMPVAWRGGASQQVLAAAPLGSPEEAVLLARRGGPRFCASELAELGWFARLVAALRNQPALT